MVCITVASLTLKRKVRNLIHNCYLPLQSMATFSHVREGERQQSPFSIQTETRISLDQFATPPRCQAKHGEGRGGWLWKRFRSQSVRMIMAAQLNDA